MQVATGRIKELLQGRKTRKPEHILIDIQQIIDGTVNAEVRIKTTLEWLNSILELKLGEMPKPASANIWDDVRCSDDRLRRMWVEIGSLIKSLVRVNPELEKKIKQHPPIKLAELGAELPKVKEFLENLSA
ncbi:hypothetical protein [Nodularia spumigena]|uniref:hypothetical protein n=1 Tax=Nodularia spumigena TaxID=70799 RepID=UPI002B211081|nr:hypothetical protein [Nodularia spumigena]MEA5559068.1 hypothetical protein [Nodularia spumigena CH309]